MTDSKGVLQVERTVLAVIDIQGKLAELMCERKSLYRNVRILIQSAKILGIPIIWSQQVPESLGETAGQISELLSGHRPVNKSSFSCCGSEEFNSRLGSFSRPQIILSGIEAHICIYQTGRDLIREGYEVTVALDAVSSRRPEDKETAIQRMRDAGVKIGTTEMILFELLESAEHPDFKKIARLVK